MLLGDPRETMLENFEPNKEYVNQIIEKQLDLTPPNMEYKRFSDITDDWPSFRFQWKVNEAGVSSEEVVGKARSELTKRDQAGNIKQIKLDLAQRTENVMAKKMRMPHPL